MKKSEVIQEIRRQKIVAVIRGDDYQTGLNACKACIDGGLTAIEMAFSNNSAADIIKELSNQYKDHDDVIIGAGTVLAAPTARMAIIAGACYIVSPSFDKETALLCNQYGVPYIPGCMTIKEIVTAMKYGAEIVKIFPAHILGTSFMHDVKAPLPQVSMMVTGGVNFDNVCEFLEAGAESAGIGGEFNLLAARGDFTTITKQARDYVEKVRGRT